MTFRKRQQTKMNYIPNRSLQKDKLIRSNFESGWWLKRKKWPITTSDQPSFLLWPVFQWNSNHHQLDRPCHRLGRLTEPLMLQEGPEQLGKVSRPRLPSLVFHGRLVWSQGFGTLWARPRRTCPQRSCRHSRSCYWAERGERERELGEEERGRKLRGITPLFF